MAETKSPFELLLEDFSDLDASNYVQIGVTLFAIAAGILVAYWVRRRRRVEQTGETSLRWVVWYSVLFPLVTFLLLLFSRAAHLVDSGAASLTGLATPLFGSLVVIRAVAGVLRSLFANSPPLRTLINSVSVIVWGGLVMHIMGVLPAVVAEMEALQIPIGATSLSVKVMLQGLLLVAVTLLGALWLSSLIETKLMGTRLDMSLKLVLSWLIRALLFVLALLIALTAVGIDLTVLSVFSGALGVGLGLGLQRIAANYVSGVAMLLERSFRVGDSIKLDTFEGRITDIKTRYTVVSGLNGREAVVPNETFMVQRVEHLTLNDSRLSVSTKVQVDYKTDLDKASQLMVEAALAQPRVLKQPAPGVSLSDFGSDGIELTLGFWINDPQNGLGGIRSNVNLAIWRAFQANGIEFSSPQRIVHVVRDDAGDINSTP